MPGGRFTLYCFSSYCFRISARLIKKQNLYGNNQEKQGKYFFHCILGQAQGNLASKIAACKKTNSDNAHRSEINMSLFIVLQYAKYPHGKE